MFWLVSCFITKFMPAWTNSLDFEIKPEMKSDF